MFLLDTDTVIYSLKGVPTVLGNLRNHLHDPLYLSTITLMELYYGACKSQQVEAGQHPGRELLAVVLGQIPLGQGAGIYVDQGH